MNKEDMGLINFSLVLSIFLCNIFSLIIETNFKEIIIAEIVIIPLVYIIFYTINKLIDKNML